MLQKKEARISRQKYSLTLDESIFSQAIENLRICDPDLQAIHARFGPPPMWAREPGYPTLVRIILEQQVSLASAAAAYERLEKRLSTVTPEGVLALSDAELKTCGFSRQKTGYVRALAKEIMTGRLDLDELSDMDDQDAREALIRLRGIGQWSADIYLLMALKRADVWPHGDLALVQAVRRVKKLDHLPSNDEVEEITEDWKPWRAVAARFLWHDYLSRIAASREGAPILP